MIDWGEVRRGLIAERRAASATSRSLRAFQRGQARLNSGAGWGPRTEKHIHWRIAELYAALKGHEQWLQGRDSFEFTKASNERYERIRRLTESMSLHEPKTIIYAAVEIERSHCPCPVGFRQTFERLMSEGRRQAREGFASQGFAYCFMRAYDSL